jgi:23S rRNA pseudouridine2457 synthase
MSNPHHFAIHKPFGMLSQFVTNQKGKFQLLGELGEFPEGTMAIGRLDKDSEGLLLLTTDGKVSEAMRSKTVEKEYWVQLDGIISDDALQQLQNGVSITVEGKPYTTLPSQVKKINPPAIPPRTKKIRGDHHGPTQWINIIITEGKFRQIRKMTAAVGYPTLRLVRVRVGEVKLGELKSGEVREININLHEPYQTFT